MRTKAIIFAIAIATGWLFGNGFLFLNRPTAEVYVSKGNEASLLGESHTARPINLRGRLSTTLVQVTRWADAVPLMHSNHVFAIVRTLPTDTLRDAARLILTQRWIEDDPAEALTFTRELEIDHATRAQFVNMLSLKSLVEALQSEPTIEAKLFSVLSEVDPDKALALALEAGLMSYEVAEYIIMGFAEKYGMARASEVISQFPALSQRLQATSTAVELWVKEDVVAALDWIQTLPDPQLRISSRRNWIQGASKAFPEEALGLASQIGSVTAKQQIIGYATSALAASDPEKAFAILGDSETITESAKLLYAGRVARMALRKDPEQALLLFESFAQEQGYDQSAAYRLQRDRTYRSAFKRWSEIDLVAAEAYAGTLTDPEILKAAQKGLKDGSKR